MSAAHNWINLDTMTQIVNSGVTAKGNNRNNTCNGAYTGSLIVGAIEKNLQKIIRDGWIRRFILDAKFSFAPNRLDDCETFVEN